MCSKRAHTFLYTLSSAGYNHISQGEVLELADRRDLESRAERREGSNPSFPIASKGPGLVHLIKPTILYVIIDLIGRTSH